MTSFFNTIKKGFSYVGQALALVFIHIYNVLAYIIDNTIGLIFTKKYKGYNEQYSEEFIVWIKIRRIIFLVLLITIIFSFNIIYLNSFHHIFSYIFTRLGELLSPNIYGKILVDYGERFSRGIGTTLYLSLIGTTIGFILAMVLSLLSTTKISKYDPKLLVFAKRAGQIFTKAYITIVRGTPMMVQAMILYWGVRGFLDWDFLVAGLATVSINTTAYLTEVLRGGIESIDKGQTEGALSLGLSKFKSMIFVVYPQAIKNSMAAIGNEFVINIKDTSVLSVIMVVDIFRVSQLAQAKYLDAFPPFIIAAIIYLVLTSTVTTILRKIEKRLDIPTKNLPSSN